jgi:hypothetical protein
MPASVNPSGRRADLLPADWRSVIRSAATEGELVAITRDYLACWSPEEIARLPAECRPGRVRDGQDIGQWAFELTSRHLAGGLAPESEPVLLRIMLFATEAAERLARLKATERARAEVD